MRQASAQVVVAVDILLVVGEHYSHFHQEADWQRVSKQAVAAGVFQSKD